MLNRTIPYDRLPYVAITDRSSDCAAGWNEIAQHIQQEGTERLRLLVVECYPGVDVDEIVHNLHSIFKIGNCLRTHAGFLGTRDLNAKFAAVLGDDPVFGLMQENTIRDFFDSEKLSALLKMAEARSPGMTLVIGPGATIVAPQADILIYADVTRWEIQRRQRAHLIGNLGLQNENESPGALYKRAFFLDWRAADRLKQGVLGRFDFLLDTNVPGEPKLISGNLFRYAMRKTAQRPFRVVPFFDPGPWGGHWMKENFSLPENGSNYAWCFDCVPEENSLLLGFGDRRIEIPALNLVLFQPVELMGEDIYTRFGAEFPIRFDYLDTVDGGNLSLQVHPLRQYIRDKFGMNYTQDESYYMFHASEESTVYLGLKENIDLDAFERDLRRAQKNPHMSFPAENYVNVWPARTHDHFLIPSGTIHCSGRGGAVLEISATPYIFTFKLWDWGRLGLDGKPRPIHIDHGIANIQWDRTTEWVRTNLINRFEKLAEGDGWSEERTGLHELEFIETRRHWFTVDTHHHTGGTLNVLNLVDGEEIVVESPSAAFAPFSARYGETFIIPAAVGGYTIHPLHRNGIRHGTIKAFVKKDKNAVSP